MYAQQTSSLRVQLLYAALEDEATNIAPLKMCRFPVIIIIIIIIILFFYFI